MIPHRKKSDISGLFADMPPEMIPFDVVLSTCISHFL